MSSEERSAWIMGVLAIASGIVYTAVVLGRADGMPLADTPYADVMLWTIGGSIVGSILLHIVVAMFSPKDMDKKDQRDKEIGRFGEHAGQSFLVIGALVALVLAMLEFDTFWIANAIYFGFVLSAILGSIVKLVAYRRGFVAW